MYHEVSNIVCFQTFSVKCKGKQFAQKIYVFQGPCGKMHLFYNFTDITKFMILFYLQRLGAEHHFFKSLKIKFRKTVTFFCCKFYVFIQYLFCFVFLLETDRKWKNQNCCCLGNSIPQKMIFVPTIQVKNCGKSVISSSQKCNFSGEGKNIS